MRWRQVGGRNYYGEGDKVEDGEEGEEEKNETEEGEGREGVEEDGWRSGEI